MIDVQPGDRIQRRLVARNPLTWLTFTVDRMGSGLTCRTTDGSWVDLTTGTLHRVEETTKGDTK